MKPKAVYDEQLVVREYYNKNNFNIVFHRITFYDNYVFRNNIPLGPIRAVLKPDTWLTLPHGYYKIFSQNGPDQFDLTVNYGNARGIGNKHPSLPVVDTRWQK